MPLLLIDVVFVMTGVLISVCVASSGACVGVSLNVMLPFASTVLNTEEKALDEKLKDMKSPELRAALRRLGSPADEVHNDGA